MSGEWNPSCCNSGQLEPYTANPPIPHTRRSRQIKMASVRSLISAQSWELNFVMWWFPTPRPPSLTRPARYISCTAQFKYKISWVAPISPSPFLNKLSPDVLPVDLVAESLLYFFQKISEQPRCRAGLESFTVVRSIIYPCRGSRAR